ncbi:4Fe-4S dicluster domain-containing protein [Dictyobacter formicarum]|uniref:4Fe-4S ferredoxin n=1 Tax=Dictyobacter formicarum TaxID=2778368 RepID=A0ABQ3VRL2_9CHLR|nr:4Fe-4S dicluster domain-containing protein [Dictyobacter formicarum]GHO88455.1 4Fe-4S ferredoxin [Dictyobacter formicarum]
MHSSSSINDQLIMQCEQLEQLFITLQHRGYQVIGPTVRNEAIVYDTLTSTASLPRGYTDEQDGGSYRLKQRHDDAFFGYAVGPHSWKQFLHPPIIRLWRAQRDGHSIHIVEEDHITPKYAFIGVRSCELHAIAIQDRVFLQDAHVDPIYQERRKDLFIVAVNCGQAGGTCFCTSMQTGPRATFGYDLALTEIIDAYKHFFVVQVGSELGADVMCALDCRQARADELAQAEQVVEHTAQSMGRQMATSPHDLKDLLARNLEHPRWNDVAQRCLSCTNCTMVCPTCFCTTVEDATDLAGKETERVRKWDSCFNVDFSYLYGGSVRASPKARYRQWMTHKLSTWYDQFGSSGCVGCGRCITWCPVAIDITEEVRAIYESEQKEL